MSKYVVRALIDFDELKSIRIACNNCEEFIGVYLPHLKTITCPKCGYEFEVVDLFDYSIEMTIRSNY